MGMLPAWPEELERRAGYKGPHVRLSRLLPIPIPAPMATPAPAAIAKLRPLIRPGAWRNRVEEYAKKVGDREMSPLLSALEAKPHTIRQLTKTLGVSVPKVDILLRALQIHIGTALEVKLTTVRGRPTRIFSVSKSHVGA